MFPASDRPSGMEFPACKDCNSTTSAADAAAAFFARLPPSNVVDQNALDEAKKLFALMSRIAPGFVIELLNQDKAAHVWAKGRDKFYGRKRVMELNGPVTRALLRTFSAKLGMALYREHVGQPLPADGCVFTQHYFNSGLQRQEAEAMVSILPKLGQLTQGRKVSGSLFSYRYNTDRQSILAAFAGFNDNLFVRVFATCDRGFIEELKHVHDDPPVSVGGLKELSSVWLPAA